MEINGKMIAHLEKQRGESANGPWVRGGFVIETTDIYPKTVAFSCMGEERIAMYESVKMNAFVNVTFVPESRQWTDKSGVVRWSTDLRFIRLAVAGGSVQTQGAPVAKTEPAAGGFDANTNNDLPF